MTKRDQVFYSLREAGPATDEELAKRLGMDGSSVRPRRIELVRSGMVRDSGAIRITSSGRTATIWQTH